MGYITRHQIDIRDREITTNELQEITNKFRLKIYCPNPLRERFSFIGHRSIRAFLVGVLGGYFDSEGRERIIEARTKLESIREQYFYDNIDVTFERFNGAKKAAYIMDIETVDNDNEINLRFFSLGGSVIGIDLSSYNNIEQIGGKISGLMKKSIPIWLYLDRDTIKVVSKDFVEDEIVEERLDYYTEIDKHLYEVQFEGMLGEFLAQSEEKIIPMSKEIMTEIKKIMWEETDNIPGRIRYSKFIKNEFKEYSFPMDTITGKTLTYALRTGIHNAEMQIVISAPTGGASGIFPANIRAISEELNIKEDKIIYALYTAAAIGAFIANNMSVSGSRHGCQAEMGTSIAMATAAILDLLLDENMDFRKRVEMILSGASMAMQSIQGLACDPLMGFVEVPCVLRNLALSNVPYTVALAIMNGYSPIISFRTAVKALKMTGEILNLALRESGTGPLTYMYILSRMEKRGIEEEIIELLEKETSLFE